MPVMDRATSRASFSTSSPLASMASRSWPRISPKALVPPRFYRDLLSIQMKRLRALGQVPRELDVLDQHRVGQQLHGVVLRVYSEAVPSFGKDWEPPE